MHDNNQYGSVITEQGDLGLGVFPINESSRNNTRRAEICPNCGSKVNHQVNHGTTVDVCRNCGWAKSY